MADRVAPGGWCGGAIGIRDSVCDHRNISHSPWRPIAQCHSKAMPADFTRSFHRSSSLRMLNPSSRGKTALAGTPYVLMRPDWRERKNVSALELMRKRPVKSGEAIFNGLLLVAASTGHESTRDACAECKGNRSGVGMPATALCMRARTTHLWC